VVSTAFRPSLVSSGISALHMTMRE
jgi:hypothetical protein